MRPFGKSELGVTLLEIMLVLAIAAMVIVMSIRYYRSASDSQQVNATMQQLQAITAAMDNLAIGSGDYTTVTNAALTSVVGANNLISATGTQITVASASATTYDVTVVLSPAVCEAVVSKLIVNSKMTGPACAGGTLTYTYDSTQ